MPGPLPLGVEKRAGGEPLAQERVGVEAALRITEQIELEPTDACWRLSWLGSDAWL